jgi:hypothetical protein
VLGAVGGGVAVAFVGVRPSLAMDAGTFVLSGLLIGLGTRFRPAAARPETSELSSWARMIQGFRLIFGDPALRTRLLFGWLMTFYLVPEGIAAPYAASLGGGPIATGLVLASTALATAIATFGVYQIAANTAFVVRVPNDRQAQAFGIANMGVVVGQGAAFVAAGAAADRFSPAAVIAVAGGLGAVLACILTL